MRKPQRPTRQVCQLCGTDEEVELRSDGPDIWTFICNRGHPEKPYEWTPTTGESPLAGRTGVGEELGVYDALLRCVGPGEWVEYGVVEHRFAAAETAAYRELVQRYGHAKLAPTKYSASSFIAHALSQLQREGLLQYDWTEATGHWTYLRRVSAWALPETASGDVTSWVQFAEAEGLDGQDWTATSF